MFILKEKKVGKDDIPTIFAWTKAVGIRPPPKERIDHIFSTPRFHSIGITVNIQYSDNHVSTCNDFIVYSLVFIPVNTCLF